MPARRYGILSDVHANYPALEAALRALDQAGVDCILNLGDMVGYGDDTARVVETIQRRSDILSIQGNHERMLVGTAAQPVRGANPVDAATGPSSIHQKIWAENHLHAGHIAFLQSLPEQRIVDENLLLVHASLVEQDRYIVTNEQVRLNLAALEANHPAQSICFFGHTHLPAVIGNRQIWPAASLRVQPLVELEPDDRYLINPGSVGQPRDKSGLIACAIFDAGRYTMQFIGLPMPA